MTRAQLEYGYRRFWNRTGDHAPRIASMDISYPGTGPAGQGGWQTIQVEASDNGVDWGYVGELPMVNWSVPAEHRQHRYWRIFQHMEQPTPAGFDNMMYEGGTYCHGVHFWLEDGSDALAGMYTNPSTQWVLGTVVSNWFQQLWGWGLVGGMNGGPAGGVSSGGVILAQSGSHSQLYTDCTYSPAPFWLYGFFGWAETVWGTPGGYEITWTWDLTGHPVVPGSIESGSLENGWGSEMCTVTDGKFTTNAQAGRGTLQVYDYATGLRLVEGDDWTYTDSPGRNEFHINTDAQVVIAYYRSWGKTLRSRPGRGRRTSTNVVADRVRFSDIRGF